MRMIYEVRYGAGVDEPWQSRVPMEIEQAKQGNGFSKNNHDAVGVVGGGETKRAFLHCPSSSKVHVMTYTSV